MGRRKEKTSDFERTPEWFLQGMLFLARVNPERYRVEERGVMEGMRTDFCLIDRSKDEQNVVEAVWRNNVTKKKKKKWNFYYSTPSYKEWL